MINNKNGFAITALLYGLSIMALMVVALMMSVMQNSRKNSSSLVRSIEEELNAYGETAQQYTSGSHDYYVPEGQTGYFKIELSKGNSMVTGTIYLEAGTILKVNLDSNPATISVDISGTPTVIMKVNTDATDVYVAGMARFGASQVSKRYQFLNGQIYSPIDTSLGTKFKASKVAETAPTPSGTVYDGVSSISLGATAEKIVAVTYNPNPTDLNNRYTVFQATNNSTLNLSGNPSISEIYIKYSSSVTNNKVTLTTNGTGVDISPQNGFPEDNSFVTKEFTLSRFGPTNSLSNNKPRNGNYYIIKLIKENSSNKSKFTFSQNNKTIQIDNTLSTTFYTPANKSAADGAATTGKDLIHYGTESYGRPVANKRFQGINSQKWRFEEISDNKYKIVETEEYKPFEVHKQDATYYAKEPHGPGPILICGAYTFLDTNNDGVGDTWTSTDTFTGNINQMWTLEQAGFGTYYLKTNHTQGGGRYIYYNNNPASNPDYKYYVTPYKKEASLFQLVNADL